MGVDYLLRGEMEIIAWGSSGSGEASKRKKNARQKLTHV